MDSKILNRVDEVIQHLCEQIEKTEDVEEKTRLTGVLAKLLSTRAIYEY